MPELPEVETLCRDLVAAGLVGARIVDAEVLNERSIQTLTPEEFRRRIRKRRITSLSRRGKYMRFDLDSGESLLVHLRMTGGFRLAGSAGRADTHDRVIFFFDDRRLIFHDTRKFGRLLLTPDPEEVLARLGPEPFDPALTAEDLHRLLGERKRAVKALLLDQSFLAGLGNIYADESLFAAGIHPQRRSSSISPAEARNLLCAVRRLLSSSIENRGTSLGDGESNFSSGGRHGNNASSLKVFRKTGEPCPRCGTPIERIIVSQRSTHLCPGCQKL
jgi:formamidopyrimidine-DNA glycosylase